MNSGPASVTYSELFYSGLFEKPTFDLLGTPGGLYEVVLEKLGPYGATLSGLKVEVSSLADANLTCLLPNLHGLLRVRLDRFDLNFVPFHDVGTELGSKALALSWNALRTASPAVRLREHAISFNSTSRLREGNYEALMARFVNRPAAFGADTKTAAGFYFSPDEAAGTKNFNIIVDRGPDPDSFNLRVDITVAAGKADVSSLNEYLAQHLNKHFDALGLKWEIT